MTLDAACRRSKVDLTHDFPATLERHGRSFRHISPWLTVEEFTREGARLFRRLVKQVDRRHNSRLDKSPSVWTLARDVVAAVDSTKVASSVLDTAYLLQRERSLESHHVRLTAYCSICLYIY
jgi:hypothetical protein